MEIKIFESRLERPALALLDLEILNWVSGEHLERGPDNPLKIHMMVPVQFESESRIVIRVFYE